MLAIDYLLQRQQDLINKQSEMIKELRQEIQNKQEIIDMHIRLSEVNEQLHQLKIQEILTPSMN
jgi:hypothetical protein